LIVGKNLAMKKFIKLLFFVTLSWPIAELHAQFQLESQIDLGNNVLSDGLYIQYSDFVHYEQKYWHAEAGFQIGLLQPQNVFLNSWYITSCAKIPAGKTIIDAGAEYAWTAFAPDLREVNWVLFAGTSFTHWKLILGTNRRVYRMRNQAANEESNIDYRDSFIEEWNIMYSVGYRLKPPENKLNLLFTVTDFDHFLIQQESNPMINARFDYRLNESLNLYSEFWYKSSGLLNIKVDYFGLFIRLGAIWEL
jgi:hypothetical protein